MGLIALSSVVYILFWGWFRHQNRRKAAGKDDYKVEGLTEEEAEELGEENPRFMYTY